LLADIAEAQMVIGEIVGKKPLLYRPPVGLVNPHLHPALAHLGMTCIGWSRSAGDAGNRRTGALRTIGSLAGTGEVVLLHDVLPRPELREQLLANLRVLFDDIRKKELATETVDAFFEIPAYA
jgi:peptidoglycan/xylan/chitin deacetylase (PgdA/CDA1 family)